MPHLLVRSKVEDYAKWKPVFDGLGASANKPLAISAPPNTSGCPQIYHCAQCLSKFVQW